MTPTQQAAIAALEAKIAGYNGSPPAYLLMLLEQAKKEAAASPQQEQPQPQQEPTEPAPPKPSPLDALEAKIASYGDQKPPTYLTLLRDQARREQEDPRARFGRQVLQSTARGNMGLLDMASQAVQRGPLAIIDPTGMLTKGADKLTGLDVSGAVDKAYGEPVRAVGRSVRDFLFGDHGKAMTDAWDKTEAQLDAAHESDWNAAGKLERARMVATDLLAPTIPLGVGAKAAEKAAAESALRAPARLQVDDIIRDVGQTRALREEAAIQRIAAMDAALSHASDGIDGELNMLTQRGSLGASDKQALERMTNGALYGDTAAFDEARAALPERFGPLAEKLSSVKDLLAEYQTLTSQVKGAADLLPEHGQRLSQVISAHTDSSFSFWHRKSSAEWAEATRLGAKIVGSEKEANLILEEAAKAGARVAPGSEVNAGVKELNALSMKDMGRGILEEIQATRKRTTARDNAATIGATIDNLADDAPDEIRHALESQLSFASGEAKVEEKAAKRARVALAILDKRVKKEMGIPDAVAQLMDPKSSLNANTRLAEAAYERLPIKWRKQLDWHRSQAVMDALGASQHPTTNAVAAARTFLTQIHDAELGRELSEKGGGKWLFKEGQLPDGQDVVKIAHDWPGMKGSYIRRDLYPAVAMAFHADTFEHAPALLRMAAKGWSISGKLLNIRAVNAVTKATLVSLNTGTWAMNAASSAVNAIANNPSLLLSAAGRDAIRAGARAAARDTRVMNMIGKLPVAEQAPKLASKALQALGLHDADAFELAYKHGTTGSVWNPAMAKQLTHMGIPGSARQITAAGKALHYATLPFSKLVRTGGAILQYGDEIPRRMTFAAELAKQVRLHGAPATEEARAAMFREAGRITEQVTPTVSEMSPHLQQLIREAPVAAFATFNADVITRVVGSTVKQGLKEVADGVAGRVQDRKASIAYGVQRLAGVASLLGFATMAYNGAKAMGGHQNQDENEAIARRTGHPGDVMFTLPEQHEGYKRTVNLSRANPYAPIASAMNAAAQVLDGADPEDATIQAAVAEFAKGVASQFDALQPAIQTTAETISGRDSFDRPLSDANAGLARRAADRTAYFLSSMARPTGAAKAAIERIPDSVRSYIGMQPQKDEPVSRTGFLPTEKEVSPSRQLNMLSFDYVDKAAAAYKKKDEATLRALHGELQRDLADYRKMGMSDEQIQQALWRYVGRGRDADLLGLLYQPEWSNYNLWGG